MIVRRVERHIIFNDSNVDNLCFLSKNLYNVANFYIRRRFFSRNKLISPYSFIRIFTRINQADYRALSPQAAQQVIFQLCENWKNAFKAIKDRSKNPIKYKGKVNLPKYKHKTKGRNLVIFTNQEARFKNGFIKFPRKSCIRPLKTKVTSFQQVRVIPQATCFVFEVVYNKEEKENDVLNPNLYLGVDLGVNNLATCTNNVGLKPFIINGKILKSFNQFFNKRKAKLQSFIGNKGTSSKIRKLTYKRNNKIFDYLHKSSRFVINYCLKHKIKTVVIGKNKNWKQEVSLGKQTNQNFVQIPFDKLIKQIQYKGEEVGIEVILVEESYTSKCSALDLEEIKKHSEYLGKRIKRGLFETSLGRKINADVNGSLNILRKVIGNGFLSDRGTVSVPDRVSCY